MLATSQPIGGGGTASVGLSPHGPHIMNTITVWCSYSIVEICYKYIIINENHNKFTFGVIILLQYLYIQ